MTTEKTKKMYDEINSLLAKGCTYREIRETLGVFDAQITRAKKSRTVEESKPVLDQCSCEYESRGMCQLTDCPCDKVGCPSAVVEGCVELQAARRVEDVDEDIENEQEKAPDQVWPDEVCEAIDRYDPHVKSDPFRITLVFDMQECLNLEKRGWRLNSVCKQIIKDAIRYH